MLRFSSVLLYSLVGTLLLVVTGPALAQTTPEERVTVTFEVIVPDGTPPEDTVFWAGSLNRWDPGNRGNGFGQKDASRPAERRGGHWRVALTASEGEEVSYKYTRGSIFSVEERADYTYRPVRSVRFDSTKVVRDTVAAWHDRPPASLADRWPTVDLHPSEINLVRRGAPHDSNGTLLYDKAVGSKFFDIDDAETGEVRIPDHLSDPVVYHLWLANAPPTFGVVVAGRRSQEEWGVYVDRDRNRRVDASEHAFDIPHDSAHVGWTGTVALPPNVKGLLPSETDSVQVSLRHLPDPPGYHTSSTRSDAPDLRGDLPFKHRTGTLDGRPFHVSTLFPARFTNFFRLVIDRDGDGTMDVGSGSDEVVEVNLSRMKRRDRSFLHSTFELGDRTWEVASIGPAGTEIRLRPTVAEEQEAIGVGTDVPDWEATTLSGQQISASSLEGKYVLLDFWGSWCAPCVEALPKLKEVYDRYADRNFEIVGFAAQDDSSLRNAVDQYGIDWPQVADEDGDYGSAFLVRGYPTYYLVGPDGTIVATNERLREDGLRSVVEEYVGE